MSRRFAILGHGAPSSGKLNLNDLPGPGERFDVLARAVNAALFVSHGIRKDSQIVLHLLGGGGPARRILFDGGTLRGVRPDERSIAGHIGSVMNVPVPPIGHFVEVSQGISHSGGGLVQTLSEWEVEGFECFLLDASGESPDSLPSGSKVGFVLSDDRPMSDQEFKEIGVSRKISLGDIWLQGHSCISIVHHILDNH